MKIRLGLSTPPLLLVLLSLPALAQPRGKPAPAEEEPIEVKLPEVDDPMLKPMTAPKRVLKSWQQAVRLAKTQSSLLATGTANVELAEGQSRQTLARSLPTLTGTASVTHHLLYGPGVRIIQAPPYFEQTTIPNPGTVWNAGLAFKQPVFAPGAWYDYATSRRNIKAQKLSYSDTQRLVLGQVADAIVGVVTAERLSEVSRVALKGSLSTLELNKRRSALGAASAVDVLRAEQEAQISRSQVVSADEGVRRAREALGLALGSAEPYGVVPSIRVDSLAADARAICKPVDGVETRADVKAAQAKFEVAERNVTSTDFLYIPTIDFLSNLNWTSNERASPNAKPVTWTIGGLLTWNIYDGGLRYGTRTANKATARIAEESLVTTKRQARIDVQQAKRAVDVAKQNLEVSTKSQQLAAENSRLARIAFVAGHGTSFDLIDADRRLREAELDLAVKQMDLVRAQIAALLAVSSCEV